MARETHYETKTIEHEFPKTKYNCDKCGREISPEDMDDDFCNTLEIYLNPEECVSSRVQMDLCSDCLEPVWQAICAAIGANPEDELRIGQD